MNHRHISFTQPQPLTLFSLRHDGFLRLHTSVVKDCNHSLTHTVPPPPHSIVLLLLLLLRDFCLSVQNLSRVCFFDSSHTSILLLRGLRFCFFNLCHYALCFLSQPSSSSDLGFWSPGASASSSLFKELGSSVWAQPTGDSNLAQSSEQSETCSNKKKIISTAKVPNPRRFVPQIVTRDIMENILNRMPIAAETWKDYPMDMKDILFNDFKDKYQFATDYDQKMARIVWDRTILDRYPDTLKKARVAALKNANSMNLADTKGNGPRGMKSEVWDGLVDKWLKPEWQRKSEAGRRNRASMPDHMLHTGGSISFGEHKRRMETKLNRPVAFKEIYDHVHKKKDGEYVSEHSKNVMESYEMAMTEKYGEDPSTFPEIDHDVWLEASGSNKKGRVLGVGHSLDIGISDPRRDLLSDGASHPSSRPVTHADVTEAINAALPTALNVALSSFVQSQLMPLLSMIPGYKLTNTAAPGRSAHEENEDNVDKDNVD